MHHKLVLAISLILSIVVLNNVNVNAQFKPTPVEKSDQKIIHRGKVFYIHTVKAGQTIYSICKAYGVAKEDIADANPGESIEVIKPGQVLKIPVKNTNTQTIQKPQEKVSADGYAISKIR